ncbi:hypothetical protein AAFF_G00373630 [Aldrovandia affinis]|uniref:ASD2 domain-containing protein n=1 Tax=Aldrovandia affinis TaxID=143900 RepID=A0AAD7SGM6_9TELE|nr:hypothetical protein AAFF_G00373630 [Aldrovandia affinis]
MSGLAASVGLPCPLSPPASGAHPDWQASDTLSQASLDTLTHDVFPSPGAETQQGPPGVTRQSSADSSASEETLKDFPREGPGPQVAPAPRAAPSLPSTEGERTPPPFQQDPPPAVPHDRPPPRESPAYPPAQTLPFLRIAESSIHFTSSQPIVQDDDEVFLQEPALPPPPPPSPPPPAPPVWQVDNTEDFPPPPPPPPLLPPMAEEEEYMMRHQSPRLEQLQSAGGPDETAVGRETVPWLPSLSPLPVTSDLPPRPIAPSPRADAVSLSPASISEVEEAQGASACEARESLELEYPLLSRRERDKSLTPVLDTWVVKKTMELMEHLFPATALPRQRRRSGRLEDRRQDRGSAAEETPMQSEAGEQAEMETDLDEVEVDLSQKKAELAKALSQSVAVLRGEREGLAEERSRLGELGARVEALVQELCKANECDKYRMFVGDQEKMVNLLLSLCGQLARVENALKALEGEDTEESAEERESLQKRRRKLCGQHEDARELKENLDRRERVVLDILGGYLSAPQLREYRHFVHVKPALMIRQRHLDELIRLGEEQLHRLGEDLTPENSAPAPCSSSPPTRSTTVTSL